MLFCAHAVAEETARGGRTSGAARRAGSAATQVHAIFSATVTGPTCVVALCSDCRTRVLCLGTPNVRFGIQAVTLISEPLGPA